MPHALIVEDDPNVDEDLLIRATLDAVGGTRHRAAALLGISPKTLYNKLQRMKMN